MVANQIIGGDLVETIHSGKSSKFVAFGKPGRKWANERKQEFPAIYSYAFQNGPARGVALVNLDLTGPQDVVVAFDGAAASRAERWLLSGDSPILNNELEQLKPQVTIAHDSIEDFRSGYRLTLPPHSITAVRWQMR